MKRTDRPSGRDSKVRVFDKSGKLIRIETGTGRVLKGATARLTGGGVSP